MNTEHKQLAEERFICLTAYIRHWGKMSQKLKAGTEPWRSAANCLALCGLLSYIKPKCPEMAPPTEGWAHLHQLLVKNMPCRFPQIMLMEAIPQLRCPFLGCIFFVKLTKALTIWKSVYWRIFVYSCIDRVSSHYLASQTDILLPQPSKS